MKRLLLTGLIAGAAFVAGGCDGFFTAKNPSGVRIGATVEEVEKALGPAGTVLPNFGRELRIYKVASGNVYTLIFEDGKVVEIQQ
jgi:hypothetical protein